MLTRTLDSIRHGVEYIRRSRRADHGWGYPDKHDSQSWATGHALMALCAARSVLALPEEDTLEIINEGITWLLDHSWEWCVEAFPPAEERSMYEVGVGLISLHRTLPSAGAGLCERAHSLIEASIRSVCEAQNEDGGWDATIWRNGHSGPKGMFSEVGATTLAIQSLAAWHRMMPSKVERGICRGVDWLLKTQNGDGSWNDGSRKPESGTRLFGQPSVTAACDAVRGIRAGMAFRQMSEIEFEHEDPIRIAIEWVRRQERTVRNQNGANGIGWGADPKSHNHLDSVITCMTIETLVQVDDAFLPLFAANAQWLMDSQDRAPDSSSCGAWTHGDSFRSTLCLVEYYKKIKVSPFFAVAHSIAEEPV